MFMYWRMMWDQVKALILIIAFSASSEASSYQDFDIFEQEFVHLVQTEDAGVENEFVEFQPPQNVLNELDSKTTEISNCVCGVQPQRNTYFSVMPLIEGGIEAEVNEFPWVVALIQTTQFPNGTILKRHFCGGTLINDKFVLTAQHCLLGAEPARTEVWLNEHDILLSSETFGETLKRSALRFIPHPDYNKFMHYNDLALIELVEEVDIADGRLRSICLPKFDENLSEATTAGWGQIGFNGPKSDKLLKVNLPVISNSQCINGSIPYYKRRVTDHSICAGDLERGKRDSCPGDSGGGLFARKASGNYVLLGVCSFGVRCGESRKPGVYVKVSKYTKWIENESRGGRQCRS